MVQLVESVAGQVIGLPEPFYVATTYELEPVEVKVAELSHQLDRIAESGRECVEYLVVSLRVCLFAFWVGQQALTLARKCVAGFRIRVNDQYAKLPGAFYVARV